VVWIIFTAVLTIRVHKLGFVPYASLHVQIKFWQAIANFGLPMVKLHTMLIRAAPCVPITAAALPPPGVAYLLAKLSRNCCIGWSFISLMYMVQWF
jgi:hypothetical protein